MMRKAAERNGVMGIELQKVMGCGYYIHTQIIHLLLEFMFSPIAVSTNQFCSSVAFFWYQKYIFTFRSCRDNLLLPYADVWFEVNMLPHMGYSLIGKVILIHTHAWPSSMATIPLALNGCHIFYSHSPIGLVMNGIAEHGLFLIRNTAFVRSSIKSS